MKADENSAIKETKNLTNGKFELLLFNILIPLLSVVSILICLLPEYFNVSSLIIFILNMSLTIIIVAFTHELIHTRESNYKWNYLLRLNLHVYSPFTLGFNDLRKVHLTHHRFTNGNKDPDYPCVKGGRLQSFFSLAFLPEVQFFYVIKNRMWDKESWITYLLRMMVLFTYILIVGVENYLLLYLLASKLAYSIAFYLFSYEAHTNNDRKRKGTVNLIAPLPLLPKLLIGPYAYNIAHFHATHHSFPWVSGRKLNLINEYWASKHLVNKEDIDFVERKVIY